MSSWEGLWCRFEGESAPLPALRTWAAGYRTDVWRLALAGQGIEDEGLALELGEAFGRERRARHEAFEDARAVVFELAARHRLGLITNGALCLQREKLESSGLAALFEVTVISGELGYGKPDPRVFACALERLGTRPAETVMVGNSLKHDIAGALDAGLRAVWVNRDGDPDAELPAAARRVRSLAELPALLA
jgi:putative hydrolase of the HAD superfamily